MISKLLPIAVFSLLANSVLAATLTVESGADIQAVINQAADGDTILVEPGHYHQSVYIDKENITFKGLTEDGKYAELDGKMILNDGIIASGHGVTIDGFKVKGYKGNGIMTQGANNFKIINNVVDGAFYAIFPQFGKNGLIKGNVITGAEDAGVYVGMCDNIDVLENIAHSNVIGLEFENTRHAVMADNKVYNNSTGILLSLIPGLPVKDSRDMVIRNNEIKSNNLKNFAPASSIASTAPEGVGIVIEGIDNIWVKDNLIEDNHTAGIFVVDMISFGLGGSDAKVEPYSDNIQIHKNTWKDNGNEPIGPVAELLAMAGQTGIEMLTTGKERDACMVADESMEHLGTKKWTECDTSSLPVYYTTAQLDKPLKSPKYTAEQKGRLTYLAVCTGCHAYNTVLHGPSVESIKALYANNLDGMKAYIKEPVRKRADFPEMPPQHYLGDETINAIANYIMHELEQ